MSELKNVPLLALHIEQGAKLVPFAGYNMPVQYTGVLKEHLHTREHAGLFDVSHMGQIFLKGVNAAQALETLLIQQGVVAIAKAGLTADQVALVRETGVVVVTDLVDGTDVAFTQDAVEELADKIVELVRL